MASCLRKLSHKILPLNGIVTTKNHSNRLAQKIPVRTQFLEDVSAVFPVLKELVIYLNKYLLLFRSPFSVKYVMRFI